MKAWAPATFEEQVREAFHLIDHDGGGTISANELKQVMKNLGDNLSHREVEDMIREIDLDGDGEIDYQGTYGLSNKLGIDFPNSLHRVQFTDILRWYPLL